MAYGSFSVRRPGMSRRCRRRPGGEDVTVELLRAAGVTVTAVDIDELDATLTAGPPPWPDTPPWLGQPPEGPPPHGPPPSGTARIEFASAPGPQHTVAAHVGYALALAAGTGAPVRVSDAVMEQLAVPVCGGDLLGPFLGGPRFEPRNLAFADGLAGWDFGGSFRQDADESHRGDYSCAASWGAEGGSAVLSPVRSDPAAGACHLDRLVAVGGAELGGCGGQVVADCAG